MFFRTYFDQRYEVNHQIKKMQERLTEMQKVDAYDVSQIVANGTRDLRPLRWWMGLEARRRYLAHLEQTCYLLGRRLIETDIQVVYNIRFVSILNQYVELQQEFTARGEYLELQNTAAWLKRYDLYFSYFNSDHLNALQRICGITKLQTRLSDANACNSELQSQLEAAQQKQAELAGLLARANKLTLGEQCTTLCSLVDLMRKQAENDDESQLRGDLQNDAENLFQVHAELTAITHELSYIQAAIPVQEAQEAPDEE